MRCGKSIRLFFLYCMACLPVIVFGQADTIDKLPLIINGTDSGRSLDILRSLTWHVHAHSHDGRTLILTTRRPDSALLTGRYDSVIMSATFLTSPRESNNLLALSYILEGSLSVKLNGVNIVAVGEFDSSGNYERRRFSQYGQGWFIFSDSLQHMEVVYIPYKRTHLFDLSLKVKERIAAQNDQLEQAQDRDMDRGVAFYYLAFGIVFISLFASARQKTEYLYFALFCLFGSTAYILSSVDVGILYNLEGFAGILCFEFLAFFFCKILMGREPSVKPLIVIAVLIGICTLPPVRYYYVNTFSGKLPVILFLVYSVLYVYTVCMVLYYLIKGIGKKQWEARTVIVVCLVPVVAVVAISIGMFVYIGVNLGEDSNTPEYTSLFGMLVDYLSAAIIYVYPLSAVYIVGRRNMLTQKTLQEQVISISRLSEDNLQKEKEKQHILEHQKEELEREVAIRTAEVVTQKEEIERQHSELKIEKTKSDDLLRNILPEEVATELKAKGHTEAKLFDNVTVLFTDFVNFTVAGELMTPQELVDELHACFKVFDEITVKYSLEKIKTIGDAYLAVCGLPKADDRHAERVVGAAREISAFMRERVAERGSGSFNIRIGIHSGPVVAGIVGVKKFAYDVWGDTVNTAARLEQTGEPGKINISQRTYELVKAAFTCEYRGEIAAKNKAPMKMYFVQ